MDSMGQILLILLATFPQIRVNAVNQPQRELVENHIYGGIEAPRDQHPFMIALILDQVALCGGSLISSTTVLTAARCVLGFQNIAVHLGAHNLTDETEEGRMVVKASRVIAHENYNPANFDNDIGIVKLPLSVEATNILPVALPSRSFAQNNFVNYTARIYGWGISPRDFEFSDILKTAESIVISNKECENLYAFVSYVTPFKMCLDNVGESGGCLGDSGGPAVIESGEDGKVVQIGIVSFSFGKCGHNLPLILVRISQYLDWIQEHAGVTIED